MSSPFDSHDLDAGAVLVGGFDGPALPPRVARDLGRGALGGVILFRRNLTDPFQARALCASVAEVTRDALVCLDQEGGRVQRLRAPFFELPPMRALGAVDDVSLTERAAAALAEELRAVGVNFDLAPVCDVDSNPANPVIGDRAFGADPERVSRHAVAFLRGLQSRGVLACAKHFPGHGDTDADSHHALPVLPHDRDRLDRVELPPFVAAARAGVAAVMTAHVRFDALDPAVPATLSPAVIDGLFKRELCAGVTPPLVVSDDLLMRAVSDRWSVAASAVLSVSAGCDLLLVCGDPDAAAGAREALSAEARRSPAFAARLSDAASRVRAVRARAPLAPDPDDATLSARFALPSRVALSGEVAARCGGATAPRLDPTERSP